MENQEERKYGYWSVNEEKSYQDENGYHVACNCSACGYSLYDSVNLPKVCPECQALMVVPLLSKTAIDGRDICSGDIVKCDVAGYGRLQGIITRDGGQWHLDNSEYSAFVSQCDNFEIIKGTIPEGEYLCRDYDIHTEQKNHKNM